MVASPWPANENVLAEWISLRARGSTTERALKPDTLQSCLSALRSVHVDRRLPTDVFQSEWLHRIVMGIRRLIPHEFKARASPITLDILGKITSPNAPTSDKLNLDTAYKVAFVLRSGEFLHDRLDRETFENTSLTRSDVTFAENDEYILGSSAVKLTLYSRESTSYLLPLGPLRAQYTPFANSTHVLPISTAFPTVYISL
jgi:hypothetical protein